MLDKTSYTTRTDLKPEELAAMIEVRNLFDSGELHPHALRMSVVMLYAHATCGTVGCIGGWMGHVMGLDTPETHLWMGKKAMECSDIHALFYPKGGAMWCSSGKDAVIAIDNYLAGSENPWGFYPSILHDEQG